MTQHEKVRAHVSQMILNLGIKSVRMDEVAADHAKSKRTLYEMYGDKEEMLYQSIVYLMEERKRLMSQRVQHCQNMLEVLLISVRTLCVEDRMGDIERRLIANLKKFYPEILARVQQCHAEMGLQGLKYALDQCRNEGYLDPYADIELMAQLFFRSTGVMMGDMNIKMPEGVSREQAFGALVINFLRGLSSAKGLMVIDEILTRERSQQQDEK